MIALYVRVSVADRGSGAVVSRSILSQEAELRGFVAGHAELEGEVRVFADDGISGRRESRDALDRLLLLAMGGQVACVVVRDLSRLARSYVHAGTLLFRTFPALGVRVISVEDGYDSARACASDTRLLMSVRMVLDEGYCYMVSERVHESVRMLWDHGRRFGANAPYGYVYDKGARGYLRVDPEAAEVVRRVFVLAAGGKGPSAIARELTQAKVPTPADYRALKAGAEVDGERSPWTAAKVSAILRREAYKGELVAGKRVRVHAGSSLRRAADESEWVRFADAHDALVSEELFRRAQGVLRPRKGPGGGVVGA